MTSRERVLASLARQRADRAPQFEIWIDAFFDTLGRGDPQGAYVDTDQET